MYRVILMYVQEHVSCVHDGLCVCMQVSVLFNPSGPLHPTLHTHRHKSETHMHMNTHTPHTHMHKNAHSCILVLQRIVDIHI